MNRNYLNKVVWITGASSGIGAELARQFDSEGARLVLSARNELSLNELKASLKGSKNHLVLPLDLAKSENFKALAQKVKDEMGDIDVLINNGGISQRATASETSMEVEREIMEVNYFGNIALSKAVLPFMQQKKSGQILVISSIAGKFGFFLRSAYSASKHALIGYYESLSLEEAKNNIKITIACPGKINTEISRNALSANGEKHGEMDHNQITGMPVEECVTQLIIALKKEKREVLIGGKEVFAVKIKRFFPALFWRIIRNQKAT